MSNVTATAFVAGRVSNRRNRHRWPQFAPAHGKSVIVRRRNGKPSKYLRRLCQPQKCDPDGVSSAARSRSGNGAVASGAPSVTPALSQRQSKKRGRTTVATRCDTRVVSLAGGGAARLSRRVFPNGAAALSMHGAAVGRYGCCHFGVRFSRNAVIPSWASSRVALSAMTSVARS